MMLPTSGNILVTPNRVDIAVSVVARYRLGIGRVHRRTRTRLRRRLCDNIDSRSASDDGPRRVCLGSVRGPGKLLRIVRTPHHDSSEVRIGCRLEPKSHSPSIVRSVRVREWNRPPCTNIHRLEPLYVTHSTENSGETLPATIISSFRKVRVDGAVELQQEISARALRRV